MHVRKKFDHIRKSISKGSSSAALCLDPQIIAESCIFINNYIKSSVLVFYSFYWPDSNYVHHDFQSGCQFGVKMIETYLAENYTPSNWRVNFIER